MASAAQAAAREIPEKSLFRIGEVSRLTDTKAFVLRFWETEFPSLQPVKSPSGHRLYRREDIETVFQIKRLLYEQGFTIAGARKYLAEAQGAVQDSAEPAEGANENGTRNLVQPAARVNRSLLLELREELLAVLTLLKRE
jgi:DNA-binding transcriptional MerR regulator